MAQSGQLGPGEKVRDALAVVAVLAAVVALAFAIATFVQSGGPDDTVQTISQRIAIIQSSLRSQDERASELSSKLRMLETRLNELSENADGILAGGPKPSQEEVVKLVRGEILKEFQKRIDEFDRAEAPAQESTDEQFDAMLASMIRACAASDKTSEVQKIFRAMRAQLNQLGRTLQPPRKTPWPEFHKKAASARQEHLDRLKQTLSADQYKKFEAWVQSAKDPYTRRFFGLGQ